MVPSARCQSARLWIDTKNVSDISFGNTDVHDTGDQIYMQLKELSVADPGFPRGGANLLFGQFFPKTA